MSHMLFHDKLEKRIVCLSNPFGGIESPSVIMNAGTFAYTLGSIASTPEQVETRDLQGSCLCYVPFMSLKLKNDL